jgi:hypothetical protein
VGADLVREVPLLRRPSLSAVAAAVLPAAVFALDLARAYVGIGLRPWQWAAGLACVGALWAWLGERGLPPRARAPWALLALFLVPTYVDHARVLDRGDSLHYYSFLRSMLFDGDLQVANDYAILGWPEAAALPNVLPIGAPLLWSPVLVPVHLLREAARVLGLGAPDGAEPLYQATVAFATLLYGTAALFLLMATLRRWAGPWAAFWATVIAWVGSPLRFYLAVLPGMAHGVEFFAAVLVVRAYLAFRDAPDVRRAAGVGAACGLVFLTRSQDGLLLLLPAAELATRLARGASPALGARWAAAIGIAFVVAALPQIAVWQAMFGTPVLIPHRAIHGNQFLHAAHPELLGALVSERGGLFASYPAMVIAIVGLALLARRDWRYVAAVVPAVVATWYLNASVFDWYHVRRFTGVVPLLAPGLAVAIAPAARFVVLMAVLAFAFLRYDVAVDALRAVPGDPAPVGAVAREMGDAMAADVYALVEPVQPAAAARMLAIYTGTPAIGREPATLDLAAPAIARLPLRARNLSAPAVHEGIGCRWVRGDEARLFLPVARLAPLALTLTAAPADPAQPQVLALAWNDVPLGARPMTPGWSAYEFEVPGGLVRSGTNVLTVTLRRPGDRPREVRRSAAIATLATEMR